MGVAAILFMGLVLFIHSRTSFVSHGQEVGVRGGIRIIKTPIEWENHPVFRATNTTSHTLRHIVVEDWSNNALLVYAEGRSAPNGNPTAKDTFWPAPPNSLASGESLWFVGPSAPLRPFTVLWLQNGSETYVNANATSGD